MGFAFLVFFLISVHSIGQATPYEMRKTGDCVLTGTGLALFCTGIFMESGSPSLEAISLHKENILFFDRWAARPSQPVYSKISDLTLAIAISLPLWVSSHQAKNEKECRVHAIMITEAELLSAGLCMVVKKLTGRPRPYVYDWPEVKLTHLKPDAFRSFYSGHATSSFCNAVLAGQMMRHSGASSRDQKAVWTAGLTMAIGTSVFRILAGEHFPSDVVAGLIIGSAIGYWIPEIHR
jgi:membrane-associated phospholipid phosphatase